MLQKNNAHSLIIHESQELITEAQYMDPPSFAHNIAFLICCSDVQIIEPTLKIINKHGNALHCDMWTPSRQCNNMTPEINRHAILIALTSSTSYVTPIIDCILATAGCNYHLTPAYYFVIVAKTSTSSYVPHVDVVDHLSTIGTPLPFALPTHTANPPW